MDKQANRIFNIGADAIGSSRHQAKVEARENGAIGHQQMAKETGIFSHGTSNTYLPDWRGLAKFLLEEKGISDIEKVSNRNVKEYLLKRMRGVNKYSSFTKICSGISKMSVAMNNYAKSENNEKVYNWDKVIKNCRRLAKQKLEKSETGRGFANSQNVVDQVKKDNHQLVAQVQAETGCRIHEVVRIKQAQLRGIGKDPYNGKEAGVMNIRGKGGKFREVYLNPTTYNSLRDEISRNEGIMMVGKTSYTASIKEAAAYAGQRYTGTHDFRHAWVQCRYKEVAGMGYSETQCLAAVSEEIGHVRPDITKVYLK